MSPDRDLKKGLNLFVISSNESQRSRKGAGRPTKESRLFRICRVWHYPEFCDSGPGPVQAIIFTIGKIIDQAMILDQPRLSSSNTLGDIVVQR